MKYNFHNRTVLYLTIFIFVVTATISGIIQLNKIHELQNTSEVQHRSDVKRDFLSIQDTDFVYGSRESLIYFVLYSDSSCQYCRLVYPKLKNIVDAYPVGTIALIYRHIPIAGTRVTVDDSEIANQCAHRYMGDTGAFMFLDSVFALLPQGQQVRVIPHDLLTSAASTIGIDTDTMTQCINEKYGFEIVQSQHRSGAVLGITIVPHTFIVSPHTIYDIPTNKSEDFFRTTVEYILNEERN